MLDDEVEVGNSAKLCHSLNGIFGNCAKTKN